MCFGGNSKFSKAFAKSILIGYTFTAGTPLYKRGLSFLIVLKKGEFKFFP